MIVAATNLRKAYEAGQSTRNLSKMFSISKSQIRVILLSSGCKMRKRGNSCKLRKYNFNQSFFTSIDNEVKAYWLGFISADGHVSDDGLHLGLHLRDKDHLQKLCDCLDADYNIKIYKQSAKVNFYSKSMVEDFRRLHFYRDKSKTQIFNEINPQLMAHYVRGLFDGDGCLSKYKNGTSVLSFCGTENTMLGVHKYLIENGMNICLPKKRNNLWILRTGKLKEVVGILTLIYAECNISLDRKRCKAMIAIGMAL